MIKQSVKKPFTVLVAVIMIIALGVVSLTEMTADLLPGISLPYMIVVTTYPGASPEKVEADVTLPLESALGTVNGVKNIASTSAENYSMVQLEFEDDTDMDSALVKVFSALDPVEAALPDMVGTPSILEISADMVSTAYIGFQYDGMDIKELTDFVSAEVIPQIERVDGVASITSMGLVGETVHIELNKKKVDKLNDKIRGKAVSAFDDAYSQIDSGKEKLVDGQKAIDDARKELPNQWNEYYKGVQELEDQKDALDEQLDTLYETKDMLELAADIPSQLEMAVSAIADLESDDSETLGQIDTLIGIVRAAVVPVRLGTLTTLMSVIPSDSGMDLEDGLSQMGLSLDDTTGPFGTALPKLQSFRENVVYQAESQAVPAINQMLEAYDTMREQANLAPSGYDAEDLIADYNTPGKPILRGIQSTYSELWSSAYSQVSSGISMIEASKSQFAAAEAQLDAARDQLESAPEKLDESQKQLDDGWKQFNDSVKQFNDTKASTLDNANANQLLSLQTLAGLIYAQNFSMPAGYIDDKNSSSWLLKMGENFNSIDELNDTVLCNIDGIGDVKISDVADITLIDNSGKTYAKMNGGEGILLSVYKSSTASTKEVGDAVVKTAKELEEKYPGLHSVNFFNQGDYISLLTGSIAKSMIIGAILAIIILAIFLKDVKPTLVVAISIPLSVLVAIIALYFSGTSLNIMSLAGLALGVGMLVDNSIVVIENIYRLKTLGMTSAQAAVTGARQVAAPIISSTLTTICVFLPMVFTTGIVKELLMPMAYSVVFCLCASLLVALSVVPAAGSTLLRNSTEKKHEWFDKLMDKYGHSLDWCLTHKAVPLLLAISLLAASVFAIIRMGVVVIPEMYAEPLAINFTVDEEKSREESYAIADELLLAVSGVEGVETASAMTSGSMMSMFSGSGNNDNAYHSYLCYVLLEGDNPSEKTVKRIVADIEEATKDIDCEMSISANEMDMSMLTGSGLAVHIYGNDSEVLESISEDIMQLVGQVEGYINIDNGMAEGDDVVHLVIDKNKAMSAGISVAQLYQEISTKLTNEVAATKLTINDVEMDVEIADNTKPVTKENLLDQTFSVTGIDGTTKTYVLGDFASLEEGKTLATLTRDNNSNYMTVSAEVDEGYNATLLSRQLKPIIEEYKAPLGYRVSISGESETVNDMLRQMSKLIALGFLFIYLVMVAQFQSLLSPFIVLFTVPLAFTGGMAGLLLKGEQLSVMSLMGFTILMGTVVNNGIVFVDYVNQLRVEGKERREALIETGKVRMRPILMTALTTILAMSNLLFGKDIGSQMGGGMAVVIMGGLTYATFMTLYIIPIIYDIFFKKPPIHVEVE